MIKSTGARGALWVLIVAGAFAFGGLTLKRFLKAREANDERAILDVIDNMRSQLTPPCKSSSEKVWFQDVAGLYSLGVVAREVAEADVRPLVKLVDKPQPYRGYLFVAMETAEAPRWDMSELVIKNDGSQPTFAFCVFPAEESGEERFIYLVSPFACYRKLGRPGHSLLRWPTESELRSSWQKNFH